MNPEREAHKSRVDDLVKAVLDAMDVLIRAQLASTDPMRYRRIAKCCGHANALLGMAAVAVGQLVGDDGARMCDDNDVGEGPLGLGFGGGPLPLVRAVAHGNDMADVLREFMASIKDLAPKVNPSPVSFLPAMPAPSLLFDLEQLLAVRERLAQAGQTTSVIDDRISATLKALEKEQPHGQAQPTQPDPSLADAGAAGVVRSELLWRHQPALGAGSTPLPAGRREALAPGDRGDGETGGARQEEELDHGRHPSEDG